MHRNIDQLNDQGYSFSVDSSQFSNRTFSKIQVWFPLFLTEWKVDNFSKGIQHHSLVFCSWHRNSQRLNCQQVLQVFTCFDIHFTRKTPVGQLLRGLDRRFTTCWTAFVSNRLRFDQINWILIGRTSVKFEKAYVIFIWNWKFTKSTRLISPIDALVEIFYIVK